MPTPVHIPGPCLTSEMNDGCSAFDHVAMLRLRKQQIPFVVSIRFVFIISFHSTNGYDIVHNTQRTDLIINNSVLN